MPQEQHLDLISWWKEQSFPGKELFKLEETGSLVLVSNSNIKERVISSITNENREFTIKGLIEKFAVVEAKTREIEVEWLATEDKLRLADKVVHFKEYLQHVNALGDFQRPALLIKDWEQAINNLIEEHYAAKLKLVEMAETFAVSEDWKEAAQAFRDITDKWKQTGHVDKNRNDTLWNRIETARKTFHDRKRHKQEEEEKDLLVNLDLKIDLVEQAESISNSVDWKNTTEVFHRLTEEWKTIGHTLNKKNEELWQRFLAAKSNFFERKRMHYNQVQQEQENNYALKLSLVEKAQALRESTEWSNTAQAYASLMEEWKKIGRVPHDKSDEVWKKFMEPQEHFYEARRRHIDEIKAVQESNYTKKLALLNRAEQLKHSSHWGDAIAEMNELLEEWKKIGYIAREHGDKMWEDFNAARKFFFARRDANRELRKQHAEAQVIARKEHAKDLVVKLRTEIKEEEEKLADFKSAIQNITPGKKAEELRTHLANLISEGEQKITRLQGKFQQASDDLKGTEVGAEQKTESLPASSEQIAE